MPALPTRTLAALLLALALPPAPSARADEISDGLVQAGQRYGAGDLAGALKELGFAHAALTTKLNDAFTATFPAAPQGWQAVDAAPQQPVFMGLGQSVERRYDKAAGGALKLTITLDSPLMQTMAMLAGNPIMAASAGYVRTQVANREAMLKVDQDSGEVQLLMVMGGRLMITADGDGGATGEDAKALVARWDLDQVVKLGGL